MEKKTESKGEYKSPSYTRKAVADWRKKKDIITLNFEKGEKERLHAVGMDNPECIRILRAEMKRRQSAKELPDADELPTFEP